MRFISILYLLFNQALALRVIDGKTLSQKSLDAIRTDICQSYEEYGRKTNPGRNIEMNFMESANGKSVTLLHNAILSGEHVQVEVDMTGGKCVAGFFQRRTKQKTKSPEASQENTQRLDL